MTYVLYPDAGHGFARPQNRTLSMRSAGPSRQVPRRKAEPIGTASRVFLRSLRRAFVPGLTEPAVRLARECADRGSVAGVVMHSRGIAGVVAFTGAGNCEAQVANAT